MNLDSSWCSRSECFISHPLPDSCVEDNLHVNPVYAHFGDADESTTEDIPEPALQLTPATAGLFVMGRKSGRRGERLRDAGVAFAIVLAAISLGMTMSNRCDCSCRDTSATQASHAQVAAHAWTQSQQLTHSCLVTLLPLLDCHLDFPFLFPLSPFLILTLPHK